MATTTATITMSSADLTGDALALTTVSTLTKAGTATGMSETSGVGRKTTSATAQYVLFDGNDYAATGSHKVYLKNTSSTSSEFFTLTINAEEVGRLYAGDWAFLPWGAHDADNDIKITPSVSTSMTLEYMLIYQAA
tara:strand:+ start:683 stop:1090 length:408 start_codon:yes stop_codon:yes gene_type:complete